MAYMLIRSLIASLCIAAAVPAAAEIEKLAIPSEKGMQFHWWPKLSQVPGWQQDSDFSFRYSVNALAPVGESFGTAETVMYAKAVFKPRVPEVKSLEMLIENDKNNFLKNVPGVTIRDAAALTSADGRIVVSLTYTPSSAGNWERVSYLEEGEFFLIFTVSSRTQKGFEASAKAYEALISQYHEKP